MAEKQNLAYLKIKHYCVSFLILIPVLFKIALVNERRKPFPIAFADENIELNFFDSYKSSSHYWINLELITYNPERTALLVWTKTR